MAYSESYKSWYRSLPAKKKREIRQRRAQARRTRAKKDIIRDDTYDACITLRVFVRRHVRDTVTKTLDSGAKVQVPGYPGKHWSNWSYNDVFTASRRIKVRSPVIELLRSYLGETVRFLIEKEHKVKIEVEDWCVRIRPILPVMGLEVPCLAPLN